MAKSDSLTRKLFSGFRLTEIVLYAFIIIIFFALINNVLTKIFDWIGVFNVRIPLLLVTVLLAVLIFIRSLIVLIEKPGMKWKDLAMPVIAITLLVVFVFFVFPYIAPQSFQAAILNSKTTIMSMLGL